MTVTAPAAAITAQDVLAAATEKYGEDKVGAAELSATYEAMQAMAAKKETGVFYTPEPVAKAITRLALEAAIAKVLDKEPEQILRIIALEPACGCGIFLVEAARLLAANYAGRLFGGQPNEAQVFAVMPTVILLCVFGIELDPVAAELSRVALSLETGGVLTPEALERNVICGNTLTGDTPPALDERTGPAVMPPTGFRMPAPQSGTGAAMT